MPVSHEWGYQHIAEDKANGGKLYKHLRQGHKSYRKGQRVKAEVIKNAVSIDDRPTIVDSRERFGDWEIDTVLGKHGTGSIVILLERKSRFFLIQKVDSKSAQDVAEATINLLKPYKKHVHTITADNGREFANHEAISERLETEFTSLVHTVHGSEVQMMQMDYYANIYVKGRTYGRWEMMLSRLRWRELILGRRSA